jgi:hypothetical protein
VSRRYVATLAVLAALILSAGLVARQLLEPADAPNTAPPSQAAPLQQLSQEGLMRRTAAYVADRVAAVATYAEYVPAARASGVRWRADSVLTADRAHIVRALAQRRDTLPPAVPTAPDTVRREWLLIVGRDASGRVLSATQLAGGRATLRCGSRGVETILTGTRIDEQLAGAGIFTLNGELLGMAAWCGERVVIVRMHELLRMLAAQETPTVAESSAGFSVAVGDSLARRLAGSDTAFLVTAVRRGTPASAMGMRVGDLLVSVNGRSAGADSVRRVLGAARIDSVVVARRKGGKWMATALTVPRAPGGDGATDPFGLRTSRGEEIGVPVTFVAPGSVAERAGLRIGDQLLRVADAAVSTPESAARLLAAAARADSAPVLVAFERDGVERGVLLQASAESMRGRTP